jgi:hypothetical protein
MTHVVIVTDRPSFESAWTPHFTRAGVGVEVVHPERCASAMTHGRPLLIDGASTAYDEDELLAHAALARALGIAVGVVVPHAVYGAIEDLLDDVCGLRVARREEEVPRVIASLLRAGAASRARFEYLTVSPRGEALLSVAGDGSAILLPRPTSRRSRSRDRRHQARRARVRLAEHAGGARGRPPPQQRLSFAGDEGPRGDRVSVLGRSVRSNIVSSTARRARS